MKRETVYLLANGCASCDPKTRNLLKTLHKTLLHHDLMGSVRIVVLEPGNTLYRKIEPVKAVTPVIEYRGGTYNIGQIKVLVKDIKEWGKVS